MYGKICLNFQIWIRRDCARANKGLFLGIFVLVMTIISLILFFVLITRPGYQALAVLEVNITEFVLYTMTTVAVLIGMCQVLHLTMGIIKKW